jgi:hypothetical protein
MSEVGDLSFVVDDGVLSDPWQTLRFQGDWNKGGFIQTPTIIPGYGVISVASAEDVEMVPEGDQITGAMVFHSAARLYVTEIDQQAYGSEGYGQVTQRISDQILWLNQRWRVLHVSPYAQHGFWKVIAVRMQGN